MSFDRAIKKLDISHARTPLKLLRGLRHDLFYSLIHRETTDMEDLGDSAQSCNWTICTRGLGPHSVVYSAGVGKDISFEHALADKFGVKLILLDPSPTGLETMELNENHRPEFEFLPIGLAGKSGVLSLAPPGNPEEGSWMMGSLGDPTIDDNRITVPCETVQDLMMRFGHNKIDLIKMDIEGAEFEVLDSILESGVEIGQIAVEYHNAVLEGVSRDSTIGSLWKLWRRGYRIINKGGSNHTLLLNSRF